MVQSYAKEQEVKIVDFEEKTGEGTFPLYEGYFKDGNNKTEYFITNDVLKIGGEYLIRNPRRVKLSDGRRAVKIMDPMQQDT